MSNPNFNKQFFVYYKQPKFDNKFLSTRKHELQQQKTQDMQKFLPKEETINDVFLQYLGYFRNK
jgi:hypothetical protein